MQFFPLLLILTPSLLLTHWPCTHNATLEHQYLTDSLTHSLDITVSAPAITCTGRPFRLNAAVTVASNHVYPSNKIRYLNKTHHNPHPIPLVGAGASWWVEATGPATLANVSSIKQPSTGVYTLELYPFDEGIYIII
jgi:hypothetical protein